MNIIKDYLSGVPQTETTQYNGKYIVVIHNTATYNATAKNEHDYFHNNWENIQSYVHAFVDWSDDVYEIAQPGHIAWGAGYVNQYAWLQVEQCISNDDSLNQKSADNVAKYVAETLKGYTLKFDDVRFISHADASREFGGTDHNDTIVSITFDDLLNRIKAYMNESKENEVQPPRGTVFQCGYAIKARKDGPDKQNPLAYTFKAGDHIKFDRRLLANGYEWISQPRNAGSYWYIPIRELNDTQIWGEIK